MNDRELLKLAAKAAGLVMCEEWDCAADGILIGRGDGDLTNWNPFDDDGDTFRLAHQLKLEFFWGDRFNDIDDISATRRKIVEQAAACYVGGEYGLTTK